jgi:hypothetical protein
MDQYAHYTVRVALHALCGALLACALMTNAPSAMRPINSANIAASY